MNRKIICALDTGELDEALRTVKRLAGHVGAFKIGHGLVLPNGLEVIKRLQDVGADRIFLDLKFHDIPNTVALGVREAARAGVWMMTLHVSGGPAMMTAAVEEARSFGEMDAPLLMGVSVLSSIDQHVLSDHLGVGRSIQEQMVSLSLLAIECGLDGVICPAPELKAVRNVVHHNGIIVTPGIRLPQDDVHDQVRVGTPQQALADGADYLVIGRPLMQCENPEATLAAFSERAGSAH
ncbi:MAG TPA: orotidine-5'-phosphate decarboxylase [Fimbriimonadaceae bacterium]|mgnify:FL=1|nr:orotidine-5'-phosphate decarboxylase [Fimbriimonadaceae bacterium]